MHEQFKIVSPKIVHLHYRKFLDVRKKDLGVVTMSKSFMIKGFDFLVYFPQS